jgi:hypothetical protein
MPSKIDGYLDSITDALDESTAVQLAAMALLPADLPATPAGLLEMAKAGQKK